MISQAYDGGNRMLIGNRIIGIIINIICLIQIAGIVIYLIVAWDSIPDQIPGHFNASGEVNRWDSKGTLFLLPGIALVMLIVMSVVERFPHLWNTGVRITEENKFRVYAVLRGLLYSVKFIVVTMFVCLAIIQSLMQTLPMWFLPTFIAPLMITIILHIVLLVRAR